MKVYLDDIRTPPDEGWVLVPTTRAAIDLLASGAVTHVSLDNDLGEGEPEGYLVANWLERRVLTDPAFPIPVVTVHSANPVARQRMQAAIANIERARERRTE